MSGKNRNKYVQPSHAWNRRVAESMARLPNRSPSLSLALDVVNHATSEARFGKIFTATHSKPRSQESPCPPTTPT